ncbi:MAG TPA: cation:proton antiporter [Acidimicrobiia bacterium]|nr:cation:proton antiporter [Acidimicrobiia bacterium]
MTFGTLALVVAVGLLGPVLALAPTRAAPPIVIGEIAAGVLIGTTGTGTLDPNQPTLAFLAAMGFALLMFIVGTHIPVRDERLRRASRRGGTATVVVLALSAAAAPLVAVASGLHRPAVLAVLLAASSAAVVLPITQAAPQTTALLVTIVWVSLADVVTVLAVPLVLATGGVGRALAGAALVIAGAAAVGYAGWRARHFRLVHELRHASHHLDWAIDLRVSLLVLFTLAWIAERFDTSVLIAGFAAGVMVAAIGPPRRVADQLIGLGEGFFVPLFFVVLGARIDLRALVHSEKDLRLFALLAVSTSIVPVATAWIMRLPSAAGLLAAAEIGVPSAVASIGLTTGALHPGQGAAIIAAAAVSLAVSAVGATMIGANPARGPAVE